MKIRVCTERSPFFAAIGTRGAVKIGGTLNVSREFFERLKAAAPGDVERLMAELKVIDLDASCVEHSRRMLVSLCSA